MHTVSVSNALWESVWNSSVKSWYSQDVPKELGPVQSGSYLTAYSWIENDAQRTRAYYRRQNEYIREEAFDNGKGCGKGLEPEQGFPQARSGTGLAIVPSPSTNDREVKIFYQSIGGKLMSFDNKRDPTSDSSWQNQDRGFFASVSGNGYKISTNKFPPNSNPRPRTCARWNTICCRNQENK